jgi:hypothetical protein
MLSDTLTPRAPYASGKDLPLIIDATLSVVRRNSYQLDLNSFFNIRCPGLSGLYLIYVDHSSDSSSVPNTFSSHGAWLGHLLAYGCRDIVLHSSLVDFVMRLCLQYRFMGCDKSRKPRKVFQNEQGHLRKDAMSWRSSFPFLSFNHFTPQSLRFTIFAHHSGYRGSLFVGLLTAVTEAQSGRNRSCCE